MRFVRAPRRVGSIDGPTRRLVLRRWIGRALACLAALTGTGVLGVLVAIHGLDQPWLKRHVQSTVRAAAGVDVDYRAARVALLSGAEIDDLVVRSPADVRSVAPDLLRIERLRVGWSPGTLLGRRGPLLERVGATGVTLAVVVDENGRTSFDALSTSPPGSPGKPPAPKTALSGLPSQLLATAPPVGRVDIDAVTLVLIRTERGQSAERDELRGLSLAVAATRAAPAAPGWRMDANLGSPSAPLDLELTRSGNGAEASGARAALWLTVGASSNALTAALDLRVARQTLAPSVPADPHLHAEAKLRFDPFARRTEVAIDHVDAGDGTTTAATADASIVLPDDGDPVVRHAQGELDLALLLRWVPHGLVPANADLAHVRWQVDSLAAGPIPRLSPEGSLTVEAQLSNLSAGAAGAPLVVERMDLSVHAQPTGGGAEIVAQGSAKLAGVRLASGPTRCVADDVAVDLEARRDADERVSGRVGIGFARVAVEGPAPVVARDGRVDLRVERLHPDPGQPLSTSGNVALSFDVASLDARPSGARISIEGLALRAKTALEGHPPYGAEVDAMAARMRVVDRGGSVLADRPARIALEARDAQVDFADPAATRGALHGTVDSGELQASLDATRDRDAIDFGLRADLASLKAVRPFLPADLADRAPWDRIAVNVQSSGRLEALGSPTPRLRHSTQVVVERPAFAKVDAVRLALNVQSQGTALRHDAEASLLASGLAFEGGRALDDRVTLSASVDRLQPSLRFRLAAAGHATAKLSGRFSFDASRRALEYDAEGDVRDLSAVAPLAAKVPGLDAFDLSQLELGLSARGALLGVVAGVGRDGTIEIEPSPARTAMAQGKLDLRVAHFRWAKGDTAIIAPALAWHADLRGAGEHRMLDARLEIGTLHVDVGNHDVDVNGIRDEGSASIAGDLTNPEVDVTQHLAVAAVEQDLVPEYPLGDLDFALSGERSPEGIVHLADAKIANRRAGTALAVSGNIDLGEGRRTLSLTTSLTQDLAGLSTIPERFQGRGTVTVDANVTSPDLARYTLRSVVKGDEVSLALPRAGVSVETANGEVPLTVALVVSGKGVALARTERPSPYSMLRFADQHPLLSRSGFLSIARLKTPFVAISPLVGNLEIEQNVVSLRQFEMGVRGGTITGQCGIDWDGPRSTVELHVRASGVQSSHGEPFDGNIAVAMSAADRTIEGRAEILRIGERHLLDLLDLQDPLHVDPAINRIRGALDFGYPKSLRIVFDHGFASAHLELGGLAQFVSIGELRGIPMGPILDKMVAPALDGTDTKEAQ